MDAVITILGYTFTLSVGLENVLWFVAGVMLMFIFDRWVLGRRVRTDIKNLRSDLDASEKRNIAFEARISTLVNTSHLAPMNVPNPGSDPPPPREVSAAFSGGLRGMLEGSIINETKDRILNAVEAWQNSPGAGRTTAILIMASPTLEEARLIYDGYRAAPRRIDGGIANWAVLYRMEIEGFGEKVYDLAYDLTDQGEEIAAKDSTLQKELKRIYADAKNLKDSELKIKEATAILRHHARNKDNG